MTRHISRQPPGPHYLHLPASRYTDRVDAARVVDRKYANDASLPPRAKTLHELYPMSCFYTLQGRPCRVYGVDLSATEDAAADRLRVIVAGRPSQLQLARPQDVVRVTRWPDDLLKRFRRHKLDDAGFFVDPMGFVAVLEKHVYSHRYMEKYMQNKLVVTQPAVVHFRVVPT